MILISMLPLTILFRVNNWQEVRDYLHRALPVDNDRVGIGLWTDAIKLDNPNNWM